MKIFSTLMITTLAGCTLYLPQAHACNASPFIAEVCPVALNFAPRGWAFTQGQLMAVSQNDALFSLVGTIYGGDGRTTFALPDTRSRVVIGAGQGPGLSNYNVGNKGGSERVNLTVSQLGSHNHIATNVIGATTTVDVNTQVNVSSAGANKGSPTANVLAIAPGSNTFYRSFDANLPLVSMGAGSINFTMPTPVVSDSSASTTIEVSEGGGNAHTNIIPVQAIHWVIALQGVYPSRS